MYDFLLVINSNLGPILHRYWDIATYWLKIAKFVHPSHARSGWPFSNLWNSFTVPETRVFQAADVQWRFDDSSLHRFWLIHPCDRQTNRQNCDGDALKAVAAFASKNWNKNSAMSFLLMMQSTRPRMWSAAVSNWCSQSRQINRQMNSMTYPWSLTI